MILRAFLTYSQNFVTCTDRARVCFNISSNREKNVILKMLLWRRAKSQHELKMAQSKDCIFKINLNVRLRGFVSLN